MSENPKKVVLEEKVVTDHPGRGLAESYIRQSAAYLCPGGMEYEGSAVVHFYRHVFGVQDYSVIALGVNLDRMPEPQVDMGWKALGNHIMQLFGRKPTLLRDKS